MMMASLGKEKFRELGAILAKLHDSDIIHEDLTTSNILIKENTDEIVAVLSKISSHPFLGAH